MNTAKQSLFLLVLISLLAFSGWHFSTRAKGFRLDKETLSSIPDYMVSDLVVKQFDKKGILANSLTSPYLEHIPKTNTHLVDKPHILIAQKESAPWDIRSLKAKAFRGGKKITFLDEVIIHQEKSNKTEASTIKTQALTYYPNEKRATTDLLVTFERPGSYIQSKGMNAFLDEKRIELLHQARGSYVPTKG